jgi:chromosome segregation ATPase
MFRFLDLSLHGWDLWPAVRIPLDADVVLVTGPNGSGKTTLLDALRQILGAPRLSSRRRLQHYLRQPGVPALLWATVSNEAAEGGPPPFARERVRGPEATLACALVPSGGGAPEKRFAILEGRARLEDLRRALIESRDFLGPERYRRALEHAGVTHSLMNVLALEQGRTNSLFELEPRELFTRVLDMLGDRAVLERYRAARRRYEESEQEVAVQVRALEARQAELRRLLREVEARGRYEAQRDKVEELAARLPAAELQAVLEGQRAATAKLPEMRTKVQRGAVERARREEELRRAAQEADESRARCEAAEAREREREAELEAALREVAACEARASGMEAMAARAAVLLVRDLSACAAAAEAAGRALFAAEEAVEAAALEQAAISARIERLRAGLPDLPAAVVHTLEALGREGIPAALLAEHVEVADTALSATLEAALDDARFALVVAPAHEARALELARERGFPGPVDASPPHELHPELRPEGVTVAGPLELRPGAPTWLERWAREVKLDPDGTWRDERGAWVRPAKGSALGAAGRKAALARAEAEGAACAQRLAAAQHVLSTARVGREAADAALAEERERQRLLAEASGLEAARLALAASREAEARARAAHEAGRRERREAEEAHRALREALARIDEALRELRDRLAGERAGLAELEERAAALEREVALLRESVPPALRPLAERGELDGADTVRRDLERAREDLARLGDPPAEEVREEARHLEANVSELEGHVAARHAESEQARSELGECRARYLEIVHHALLDYRRRAAEIAARADVRVEMELPALENDDRVLDEATLRVRFAFDGKEPMPLGDPSFSGGQQVIGGLVLLMAMAESGGRGFFMLDEPFAHLSLDRIDQVGRFLRSTRAQFLLTAPTTLDRAQLDPASLLVVLRKKRAGEAAAPLPLVAGA